MSFDVATVAAVITVVLLLAGAVAVVFPFTRNKTMAETNKVLEAALSAREVALQVERDERREGEKRAASREADIRKECREEIAQLHGRIDALTPAFAREMATAVITALRSDDKPIA